MSLSKTVILTSASLLLTFNVAATAGGDPEAGQKKASACLGCHSGPAAPPIKGKPEADLLKALHAYKKGERKNATMEAMTKGLSDQDMENLAAFFAKQSP